MPDDGTKAPRFPTPRKRDPYRDAAPKTFSVPARPHVTVTRAEEPPSPDHLSERELEEAGFLTSEKRAARDAAFAEERAAAIQKTILWTLGLAAFEGVGLTLAFSLRSGLLRTAILLVTIAIGSIAGGAIFRRWRTDPDPLD